MIEETGNSVEVGATPPDKLLAGDLLDHVEKAFADSYRKEIDQEENIWRSLRFSSPPPSALPR